MAAGPTYYYKVYCSECATLLYKKKAPNPVLERVVDPKDWNHVCSSPRKEAAEGQTIEGKIQWG